MQLPPVKEELKLFDEVYKTVRHDVAEPANNNDPDGLEEQIEWLKEASQSLFVHHHSFT